MNIDFKKFEDKLAKKFDDMSHLVTEDLIRYWFIQSQEREYTDAEIEVPYRRLQVAQRFNGLLYNRARSDLHYKNEGVVIEFKYHKRVALSTTCKTTNMGSVFNDLNRLSTLQNAEKYLIYVFDQEMYDYYKKHSPTEILKVGSDVLSLDIREMKTGELKEDGEFFKAALASFDEGVGGFSGFSYNVQVVLSSKIGDFLDCDGKRTGFYLIAFKVN